MSRLEDKLNEAQGLRRFDPRLSFQPSSNKVLFHIITFVPMTSVAIRDVYPGSRFFPIPDPGSKGNKKEEGGKFLSYLFIKLN